jgi:exopolyphosphatase/guanosine-5'-triphosphate,3'-diphosphate pyrophosphatase
MRVATVDIGTNTVLLLVAERDEDGSLQAVAERAVITRLGEGVDRTRRLSDAAVARTLACLEEYATTIRELGAERAAVVGTSAMRDAGGGDELRVQVRQLFGVDVRVLSGDEEARLTFRGSLGGLSIESPEVAVFDIGGGSTEVVVGSADLARKVRYAASFDVGSVRLTERLVSHDPPSGDEYLAVREVARRAFLPVPPLPASCVPIGIAGTMTTLAAVSLGLATYDGSRVHGLTVTLPDLRAVVARLASLPLGARQRLPGMEPKRADVIVGGGAIAVALLEHWAAPAVRISDRGVRWGLAEELTYAGC